MSSQKVTREEKINALVEKDIKNIDKFPSTLFHILKHGTKGYLEYSDNEIDSLHLVLEY